MEYITLHQVTNGSTAGNSVFYVAMQIASAVYFIVFAPRLYQSTPQGDN
jgi:hypothetical protein